ncbi:MAG: hypothetical protein V1839_00900 [archaeon]
MAKKMSNVKVASFIIFLVLLFALLFAQGSEARFFTGSATLQSKELILNAIPIPPPSKNLVATLAGTPGQPWSWPLQEAVLAPIGTENSYPACGDGKDNDFDGFKDCIDTGCLGQICLQKACPAGSAGTKVVWKCAQDQTCTMFSRQCKETRCNDNIDNDLDGFADSRDYDCPYIDLIPLSAEKLKDTKYTNSTGTYYDYKITFNNKGAIAIPVTGVPPAVSFYVCLSGTNLIKDIPVFSAPVRQKSSVTATLLPDVSSITVFVDCYNSIVEPESAGKSNNIATYNV